MSRLLRPPIPDSIKVEVAVRQLRAHGASEAMMQRGEPVPVFGPGGEKTGSVGRRETLPVYLERLLVGLALHIGCPRQELRLDHDPALENREKVFADGEHVEYAPPANDPAHLVYRPHGAEYAGSHKIKTLVRGDHGQYSDAALARKNKRIAKKMTTEKGASNWTRNGKKGASLGASRGKTKIPQRRNPWPPQGSRKFNRRKS